MPLDGWRRTRQAHNLQNVPFSMKAGNDVFAHHMPHLIVVGTNEGGVFLGRSFALKHDDGNALVISAVNSGRDGLHLVWCHNEQVNTIIHQTVNLLHLPFITIVGGCELQLNVVVKVSSHPQLCILLVAPNVCRTL